MPNRRNFSPAFKTMVAMAAIAGQKTVAQLSSEYGVHPIVIHNQVRQAKWAISAEFSGNPRKGKNKEKKQITALQAKVGQLTMERDFLAEAWKKNVTVSSRRKLVIKNHRQFSVVRQCRLLHLNRSGLYYKQAGNLPTI